MANPSRNPAVSPVRALPVVLAVLVLAATFAPEDAQAQVAWDSPFLVSPEVPPGWGIYLLDPHPGGGIGVATTFRTRSGPGGLGYRLGLAEDPAGDLAVFAGVDVSGELVRVSEDVPVDAVWVAGAGLGLRDAFLLSFPVGVSVGRAVEADEVWFNPSVGPRVILDALLGGDGDSDVRLRLAVDLGIDVAVNPDWIVRFGGTLGDRSALALGVSLRFF